MPNRSGVLSILEPLCRRAQAPRQPWLLFDLGSDPSRLVASEQAVRWLAGLLLETDTSQRLAVVVANDEARVRFVNSPWRGA
jgi:hypothetical protein